MARYLSITSDGRPTMAGAARGAGWRGRAVCRGHACLLPRGILLAAYCLLPTAYYLLLTTCYLLPTTNLPTAVVTTWWSLAAYNCCYLTYCYLLPTTFCLEVSSGNHARASQGQADLARGGRAATATADAAAAPASMSQGEMEVEQSEQRVRLGLAVRWLVGSKQR